MAKQTLKIESANGVLRWIDRATEKTVYEYPVSDVADSLRDAVFAYGVKQIIADGGATGTDVPLRERLDKMATRALALTDGTWGERRAGAGGLPNAGLYRALVALGLVADSDDKRKAFRTLPAQTIADLYGRDDVKAFLAEHSEKVDADQFLGE